MEPLKDLWNTNDPLYKYLKIDNNFYNSILDNFLWFSDPQKFNDPRDCNLKLSIKNYQKKNGKRFLNVLSKDMS